MGITTRIDRCPICESDNIHVIKELPNYPLTELMYKAGSNDNKQFKLTEVDQRLLYCEV